MLILFKIFFPAIDQIMPFEVKDLCLQTSTEYIRFPLVKIFYIFLVSKKIIIMIRREGAESIGCFICTVEGQAFLRSCDSVPPPQPTSSPSPANELDQRHIGRLRKRDNLLTEEGVRGRVRSRIIRPQQSLVLYKSFSSLWEGEIRECFLMQMNSYSLGCICSNVCRWKTSPWTGEKPTQSFN
jgi:hypothetical protein